MKGDRRFAAVVLAAGLSSRMGDSKALLDLGGQPVVRRVADAFRRAGVGQVMVVTGHRGAEVAACLTGLERTETVYNPDYESGMYSSVTAGVGALDREGLEAFFLTPVDYPLINVEVLRAMMAAWRPGGSVLMHPFQDGRRGHPPLIASWTVPDILAHDGSGGLKMMLRRYYDRRTELPVDDPGVHFDMDTPEDYRRALELWAQREEAER